MRFTRENLRAGFPEVSSHPEPSWFTCTKVGSAALRQLDQRTGDGLTVTLEWDSETGRVQVRVEEDRSPDKPPLCFAVEPWDARAAFLHPFVYANASDAAHWW